MSHHFHGLRTVGYHVPDLERAKCWYADILGIEPYFDQPFYVGFSVGGYELGLNPDMSGVTVGSNSAVYWGVDDVQASLDRLIAHGATPKHPAQDVGDGIVTGAVTDPWETSWASSAIPTSSPESIVGV